MVHVLNEVFGKQKLEKVGAILSGMTREERRGKRRGRPEKTWIEYEYRKMEEEKEARGAHEGRHLGGLARADENGGQDDGEGS